MLTTTPLRSPFDGCGADADDVDAVVGQLADDGADLRRADVEADDDVPALRHVTTSGRVWRVALRPPLRARSAARPTTVPTRRARRAPPTVPPAGTVTQSGRPVRLSRWSTSARCPSALDAPRGRAPAARASPRGRPWPSRTSSPPRPPRASSRSPNRCGSPRAGARPVEAALRPAIDERERGLRAAARPRRAARPSPRRAIPVTTGRSSPSPGAARLNTSPASSTR